MVFSKDSDGKIVLRHDRVSYLCQIGDHEGCGGICECKCHQLSGTEGK